MRALEFLDAVAGYTQAQQSGSASRPIRLATVDPTYVASTFPGTLPKVTFDGESTLSGKRYPVMSGYLPSASDRVVLVPVGTTYLIVGALDADASAYLGGSLLLASGANLDLGGWVDYNPEWTASSSNPTIVLTEESSARYRYVDANTAHLTIFAKMAAGSAKGSGIYAISLPVTAADAVIDGSVGTALINDSGAAVRAAVVTGASTTTMNLWLTSNGNVLTDAVLTGTFVDSWFRIDFTYRVP
jgi:hypothetical protein